MHEQSELALRDFLHRLRIEHARPHPGRDLLAGTRRASFVMREERIVVELASEFRHAVLVHEVGRRNAEEVFERGGHIGARELGAQALRATRVHGTGSRWKHEGAFRGTKVLEVRHEEEGRAEEEQRLAVGGRAGERVVRDVPSRIPRAQDERRPRGREFANNAVHHEPERRTRRLFARRPKDDRLKPRAVGKQMTFERAEERGLVGTRVAEAHAPRARHGRAARLEHDAR